MRRVLRMIVPAVLAGAFVLVVPGAGNAALPPNDSVFLYKSGIGMTATVHDGTYTPVENAIDVGTGWNAATLGRDTLVLLNNSNGHMLFATLTAGHYTFVTENISVTKTFTKLTASCDSILLYSPSTGKALVTKLGGGSLDLQHLHTYTVAKNFTSVNSSCNTVTFLNNKGNGIVGTLKGGAFTKKGNLSTGLTSPLVAHTDTSFLRFSPSKQRIELGKSNNGAEHITFGPAVGAGPTRIAGTASSAIAYNGNSGETSTASLINGQLGLSQDETLTPGLQLVVGGR